MKLARLAMALALAAAVSACATGAEAQRNNAADSAPRTVQSWLEPRFATMLGTCIDQNRTDRLQRRRNSLIPARIRQSIQLQEVLNEPYVTIGTASLTTLFGRIYSTGTLDTIESGRILSTLPTDYAKTDDLVVAPGDSAWRYRTTCAAGVQAALRAELGTSLSSTEIQAALNADLTGQVSSKYQLVYGHFQSPIVRSLGSSDDVYNRDAASAMRHAFVLWDWNANNAAVDGFLLSDFYGVAIYENSTSSQTADIDSSVRVRMGQNSASIAGNVDASQNQEVTEFNLIGVLRRREMPAHPMVAVFNPTQISQRVTNLHVFQAVSLEGGRLVTTETSEVPMIVGRERDEVQQFTSAIPEDYCNRPWQIDEASRAQIENLSVRWLSAGPTGTAGCLFTVSVPFADRTRDRAIEARVRLSQALEGSHLAIPLQTINLRATSLPRLALDNLRSADMSRLESTQRTGSSRESTTVRWIFYFLLTDGAGPGQRVISAEAMAGDFQLAQNSCPAVTERGLSQVSAVIEPAADGSTNRWVRVVITQAASTSQSDTDVQQFVNCSVTGSVNLSFTRGPDAVPRTVGPIVLDGFPYYAPRQGNTVSPGEQRG
jgi:hypothetical protein